MEVGKKSDCNASWKMLTVLMKVLRISDRKGEFKLNKKRTVEFGYYC